ncbi:MAG: hypothetical protein ACOX1H_02960 [Pseudoramibacter sp.]
MLDVACTETTTLAIAFPQSSYSPRDVSNSTVTGPFTLILCVVE